MITTAQHYPQSPHKSDPDTETDEQELQQRTIPRTCRDNHSPKTSKIKSSLCKNYMVQGFCPYGNKCQFAHGPQQLRCNTVSNTSYKTKPCFSYLNKGYCPYGHRCNFIHRPINPEKTYIYSSLLENIPQMMPEMGTAQSRFLKKLECESWK